MSPGMSSGRSVSNFADSGLATATVLAAPGSTSAAAVASMKPNVNTSDRPADVNTRRQITSQETEDVIVKVHESRRNTITYGFGYEFVNRGGSVPTGTVALPGLPPVGLPSNFQISQQSFQGPRANFEYTRNNVRGKAETITIGALAGPLVRRTSFVFSDPNFRWTDWTASLTTTGEYNKENPIFTSRQGQFGFQLQRALNRRKTQNLFLRYTVTQLGLTNLLIPDLVPREDLPRIALYIGYPGAQKLKAYRHHTGYGDDRVRLGPIGESAVDGGFTGPTAWTLADYEGQPGFRGKGRYTNEQLQELVDTSAKLGWQLGLHAIGDAAIVQTVNTYSEALRAAGNAGKDHRWFLDHFTMMPPDETMRTMATDKILIAQQPSHLHLEPRLGRTRADNGKEAPYAARPRPSGTTEFIGAPRVAAAARARRP